MRRLAPILALVLAACAAAPAKVVTRTETIEVPVYLRALIPAPLLAACRVHEPDPACWWGDARAYCNGQLAEMLDAYRAGLAACDRQLAALRALNVEATP